MAGEPGNIWVRRSAVAARGGSAACKAGGLVVESGAAVAGGGGDGAAAHVVVDGDGEERGFGAVVTVDSGVANAVAVDDMADEVAVAGGWWPAAEVEAGTGRCCSVDASAAAVNSATGSEEEE